MKKQNKRIALAIGIIVIILLLIPLSYAAYTSVTSARRVVSTANEADALFSSNYLFILPKADMGEKNESSAYKYKNIPINYQSENTTQAVYVSVCNYAQGYLAKWSEQDINYHIKFSLVDLENHEEIKADKSYTDKSGKIVSGTDILNSSFKVAERIAASGANDIPYTYSGKSLKYSDSSVSTDMYTIFMDTKYADLVGVKIEVITEDNSPAYSGYGLGGVLCLAGYVTAETTGWNGEIQEAPADGSTSSKNSSDYTGFNYEVSGSGAGTVTITWEQDKFAISEIFLEDMKNYIKEQKENSISFTVGGEGQDDRFFIQFYRVTQPETGEKWKDITEKFKCTFTAEAE